MRVPVVATPTSRSRRAQSKEMSGAGKTPCNDGNSDQTTGQHGGSSVRRGALATALVTVAALASLVMAVGACSSAPDRGADAQRLKATIAAMPGVRDADVTYENSFERGANLDITVWMPSATRQQIVDVVTRINTVRGDLFDRYDQTVQFQPNDLDAKWFQLKCGTDLDAASIADQALALRVLAAHIKAGSADWSCRPNHRSLTIRDNDTPIGAVLDALRSTGMDDASVSVELQAAQTPSPQQSISLVNVQFPYSAADLDYFNALVARLGAVPWLASIGPGQTVSALSVRVHDPATAHQQLTNVIAAVGAGPARPLMLAWALENPPSSTGDTPRFFGQVDVGGCNYASQGEGELHPEKYFTADAVALQRQLRAQYDSCK